MGALLIALGWSAAAGAAVLIPARVAYAVGAVGRARRGARKALRSLRKRLKGAVHREGERRNTWLGIARGFATEASDRRLRERSIESLREEGVARVRWSSLEDAGWRSVADVSGAQPAALAAAPGVGETSASKVVEAATAVATRERGCAPDAPDPAAAEAEELLRAALVAAEERRLVLPQLDRLASEAAPLFGRVRVAARQSRFHRWLFRPSARAETVAALEACSTDAGALSASTQGLHEAEAAVLERARQLRAVGDLATEARARWPEVEAELEEAWNQLGLSPAARAPSARGGVPAEIAERVEAHPLDTEGLDVTLRRYQAFGARYLLAQERALLGDEMGLGKTIQALAAMTHRWNQALKGETPGEPASTRPAFLVVSPAGLIWNWAREIEARAPFPGRVIHGEDAQDELTLWVDGGGAAVTSYSTLRNLDLAPHLATLGPRFEFLVADEAHFVKNPEAQRTQAVATLAERARFAALLTGTPMENRPEELLEVVRLVQPAAAERLGAAGSQLEVFHEAAASVYLRRNQPDVLTELPERLERLEWVDLGPAEAARYRDAVASRNFAELRRATTLATAGASTAKLDRLDELLTTHAEEGRKVVVFSYFLEVLKTLADRLDVVGTISGAVAPDERMEIVDRFAAAEGHAVMLLQIVAGGTGLNLQAASVVVLVEPQLKPTVEDQAIARAHRMGQTERVLVHRLVARDSVDEHLLTLLAGKRELFEAYAKRSALKDASEEATEASLSARILEIERERLGM